jgi:Putative zinc-finger
MTSSKCKNPLAPAVLADYWLAELETPDEERVEEHLFACEECSGEMQNLVRLVEGIRDITRKGLLRVVVSGPFLERLRSDGLRIRQYDANPGDSVACTITEKDDLVIARLAADLSGAKQVDISQCDREGRELARVRDIPLIGAKNEVVWTQQTDTLRALGEDTLTFRLIAVDEAREQVLGEYTFNHFPSRG